MIRKEKWTNRERKVKETSWRKWIEKVFIIVGHIVLCSLWTNLRPYSCVYGSRGLIIMITRNGQAHYISYLATNQSTPYFYWCQLLKDDRIGMPNTNQLHSHHMGSTDLIGSMRSIDRSSLTFGKYLNFEILTNQVKGSKDQF